MIGSATPGWSTYPEVQPVIRCGPGDQVVDWTIKNPTPDLVMTINFVTAMIDTDSFAATGWTSPIAPGATTVATTSVPAGMSGSLVLNVYVTWPTGVSHVTGASIQLPQACVPPTTPPTIPPTIPPTTPPTTVPYTVPPTTVPYTVPPTTVPYTVPPTTVPYTVPPTTAYAGPLAVETPAPVNATTGALRLEEARERDGVRIAVVVHASTVAPA